MKIRFKEQSLHSCDVMLRDIKESDRLNAQFKKEALEKKAANEFGILPLDKLKTNIISPSYWPQANEYDKSNVEFQLPSKIEKSFNEFAQVYQTAKQRRLLTYKRNLGCVKLTLTFENSMSEQFTVTPLQAAIITQFDEPSNSSRQITLTADIIADTLQISEEDVKKELNFWVGHGVLKESQLQRMQ